MINKDRIMQDLIRLMAVPSISGTAAETRGADEIMSMLRETDYFKAHEDNVFAVKIEGDQFGRYVVAALVQGQAPGNNGETIILTGHYDVVDVDEYAQLKDIAFDAPAITKRIGELPMNDECARDIASGGWLFGRGSADMKFGHALIIELLRHYAAQADKLCGNLLYVAVCGEETNSEGMLRAVPFLNELAAQRGLHYNALLLAECYLNDDMENDPTRYIHYGATGKVMPLFFCAGKGSHADEPFIGLDANSLNAAIYERMAMNSEFCSQKRGECTPPAICLKMKDLKAGYSVSIPMYAVSYYSLLTLELDPKGIISRLKQIAAEAFAAALEKRRNNMRAYAAIMPRQIRTRDFEPCVMTYAELYSALKAEYAGDLDAHMKEFAAKLQADGLELQDIGIELVRHAYELYSDKRPMIIIAFIPPYYPDVYIDEGDKDAKRLLAAVDDIIEYAAAEFGESLRLKNIIWGFRISAIRALTPMRGMMPCSITSRGRARLMISQWMRSKGCVCRA